MTEYSSPIAAVASTRHASTPVAHICVCICTFHRPVLLRRLLEALITQQAGNDAFTLSCVVVDNDPAQSAAEVVREIQQGGKLELVYECEAEKNFAAVRNQAVKHAHGDFVAFIDDDEVPEKEWLLRLLGTIFRNKSDGALGPVRPYFDNPPPRWLERSGLCHRPVHPTGMILNWNQTRSGNVLLKRDIFEPGGIWFDPVFRTGGEDVDFFKRAMAAGKRFVWCEEAPAYELVPPERMRFSYYLRRALLLGTISLKHGPRCNSFADRALIACKSVAALAAYTLALPFLLLGGTRLWVRYLVKICHHLGRFTALCGTPIISERNF